MRIADNLEYSPVVPEAFTWAQIREAANRLTLKNVKPFPDGYYRLYMDQQGVMDLMKDSEFRTTTMVNNATYTKDNVMICLVENTYIFDPWVPTYLFVTKNSSAEMIGFPARTEAPFYGS